MFKKNIKAFCYVGLFLSKKIEWPQVKVLNSSCFFLELTSYGAGISDVSSGSSLRKEKATFDPSRKAGHFRPNRQHQDVF